MGDGSQPRIDLTFGLGLDKGSDLGISVLSLTLQDKNFKIFVNLSGNNVQLKMLTDTELEHTGAFSRQILPSGFGRDYKHQA